MSFTQIYAINYFNMPQILYLILMLVIVFIGIVIFSSRIRSQKKIFWGIIATLVFLAIFEVPGLTRYFVNINCLKNGNFEIVEGEVKTFISGSPKGIETISMPDKTFTYSCSSTVNGGLNHSVADKVKEGMYIRISYKESSILRLEVEQTSN